MNYQEAIKSEVTRQQAEREIVAHNLEPYDFFEEVGIQETYAGKVVLEWLGY